MGSLLHEQQISDPLLSKQSRSILQKTIATPRLPKDEQHPETETITKQLICSQINNLAWIQTEEEEREKCNKDAKRKPAGFEPEAVSAVGAGLRN